VFHINLVFKNNMRLIKITSLFIVILLSCQKQTEKDISIAQEFNTVKVPIWSAKAIWYQIFVERFRNGDPTNDQTREDIIGTEPSFIPADWSVTDWGHDWYKHEPWLDKANGVNFHHNIQQRRFGGDLQGVLDQMDYIESLGVNAIYFNPLNDSPSLHKYDARNYRHIDRNFGPDPKGDAEIMANEVPDDPATWQMTSADLMFLEVVKEFHKRNIKVIMDYSWNHTGTEFWALKDIQKNGKESKYVDWFDISNYDDPTTPENEFLFHGWGGVTSMPQFKRTIISDGDDTHPPYEGNYVSKDLKQHIYHVSAKWLDPNSDGDFSDGVDGYRLDVAQDIPMGFWRDYKEFVTSVNPDVYLVGELWWYEWPEQLLEAKPFLENEDQFHAVMNYEWYRAARGLFAQGNPTLTPSQFVEKYKAMVDGVNLSYISASMTIAASHDTPRISTSLQNRDKYNKYKAKPNEDSTYTYTKPDEITKQLQKMLLLHQFTFIGAPHIWNGDELGMWGSDDPDCRKPMVWDDLEYEDQALDFYQNPLEVPEPTVQDKELLAYYKNLIKLRNDNPVLSDGNVKFLLIDDEQMTIAYNRRLGEDEIIAAFNISEVTQEVSIYVEKITSYKNFADSKIIESYDNRLQLTIEPSSGLVLIKE
jgi:cyclomaltodextrinase / maltogenic alpha-amylase / neopullulanase